MPSKKRKYNARFPAVSVNFECAHYGAYIHEYSKKFIPNKKLKFLFIFSREESRESCKPTRKSAK